MFMFSYVAPIADDLYLFSEWNANNWMSRQTEAAAAAAAVVHSEP